MSERIRLAVPTNGAGGLDAERSPHFGHADSFTLVDVVDGKISDYSTIANPPHVEGGCGRTVALLAQQGASAAIVVGMGRGPLVAMQTNGMMALFDDQSPTPRQAAQAYLSSALAEFGGDHICRGH